MDVIYSATSSTSYTLRLDEDPPTLGVREPRKPRPPKLLGGAEAELSFEQEPTVAAGTCVDGDR